MNHLNEDTKIIKNITINNFPKLYPCSYFYSHLYLYSLSGQRPIDVVPSDEKEVNNRIRVILQKDMDEAPTKEVKEV